MHYLLMREHGVSELGAALRVAQRIDQLRGIEASVLTELEVSESMEGTS